MIFDPWGFHGDLDSQHLRVSKVPAWYCECPLHSYYDDKGRHIRCRKSMSTSKPSERVALDRMRAWILEGRVAVHCGVCLVMFTDCLVLSLSLCGIEIVGLFSSLPFPSLRFSSLLLSCRLSLSLSLSLCLSVSADPMLVSGLMMTPEPGETAEHFRRRHVLHVPGLKSVGFFVALILTCLQNQ